MEKLEPHEVELMGKWLVENGRVQNDEVAERIKQLVAPHLKRIAVSKDYGAWETLFQDPDDMRYWEQTYPQGEMQGGGPSKLKMITAEQAKAKYQI